MSNIDQPAAPQAAPAKKRSTGKIILFVLLGLLVVCGGGFAACTAFVAKAGSEISNEIDKELNAEKTDIKITACSVKSGDPFPTIEVEWSVTNSGKNKRTYLPRFIVDAADGSRLGEGVDSVADLTAGQTAKKSTRVLLDKAYNGEVKCSIS